MTECYEGCEHVELALECGEEIRQEYSKLLDSYNKLKREREELWRYIHYYQESVECARTAMIEEAEQLKLMPEDLAWPLVSEHGFKLAAQRWTDTVPAVQGRYKDLFEAAKNNLPPMLECSNVIELPLRQ